MKTKEDSICVCVCLSVCLSVCLLVRLQFLKLVWNPSCWFLTVCFMAHYIT